MKSGIIAVNAGMIFLIGIVVGRVAEVLSEKEDIEKEATLTQTIRAATGTVDFHDQKVIDSHQRPRVKRINFDFEDHPKLDRFPFRDLADFEDLEELNLGVCNVGGDMLDGLVSLSKTEKTRTFPLRDRRSWFRKPIQNESTRVREILGRLTQLTELSLKQSSVTDAGLVHLSGLKKLKLLFLKQTAVTQESRNQLKQMLPELKEIGIGPL